MATSYCLTAYCGIILYLIVFYDRGRHRATNTYLNRFTPLLAFLLIPLTWPLLILLNWVVRNRQASDQGFEEFLDD